MLRPICCRSRRHTPTRSETATLTPEKTSPDATSATVAPALHHSELAQSWGVPFSAYPNFTTYLRNLRRRTLDGVWVGWDDAALGASKAITEAGSDAKVTGVDAVSESIAEIEAGGSFLATIEQPWPSILDSIIAYMVAYQKDGTLPATNYEAVGTVLVTIKNASTITPSDKL